MAFCPELSNYKHLRFVDKVRHLRKALARKFQISPPFAQKASEELRVKAILRHCKVVADARNEILHSSIYSDRHGTTMMKNKRSGSRPIASGKVYELANTAFKMHVAISGARFAVTRLKLALTPSSAARGGRSKSRARGK